MEEQLNIYQKLAKIRKVADVLKKNKKGHGYNYTPLEEILAKVTAMMEKYHLSLVPKITPASAEVQSLDYFKTKATADGEIYDERVHEMLVTSDVEYIWVNDDNPQEQVSVPWFIAGAQRDPSQAFGAALTYGERYFLTSYFQIATVDNDPDAYRSKQAEAEAREGLLIAEKIIEHVHQLVTNHLEGSPNDKEKATKIVKKYARDGKKPSTNYYLIEDPIVASNLLAEIKSELLGLKEDKEDKKGSKKEKKEGE